jgi:cell division protein FtsW (lipid II flippase)
MMNLAGLTIAKARRLIQAGELSPVQLLDAVQAAIEKTDPAIGGYLSRDYQRARVTTFLDPESDPLGAGYHIAQSKIAIGSGGIFGKGFNAGTQSHLEYLPEPHTDFVFATMAEEWGLMGGMFVLAMYTMILWWGTKVSRDSHDRFCALLAAGATATIFFYIAINLLMVMGMAPAKGIPLPWMSHGGSSMMTNMICIGTIMAVAGAVQKALTDSAYIQGRSLVKAAAARDAEAPPEFCGWGITAISEAERWPG